MKLKSLFKGIPNNHKINYADFEDYDNEGPILVFLIDLRMTTSYKINKYFSSFSLPDTFIYNISGIYQVYPSDNTDKNGKYCIILYNQTTNKFLNNKFEYINKPFMFNSFFYTGN